MTLSIYQPVCVKTNVWWTLFTDGPDTGDDPVYDTADSPADTYAVVIKGTVKIQECVSFLPVEY